MLTLVGDWFTVNCNKPIFITCTPNLYQDLKGLKYLPIPKGSSYVSSRKFRAHVNMFGPPANTERAHYAVYSSLFFCKR